MNVLITSSSSKVLLIKSFIEATKKYNSFTFTADITNEIPTAFFSHEHFILPKVSDRNNFILSLKNICIENNIKLIVPTRDGELEMMAEIKMDFAKNGITILVPSEKTVELCLNKRMFAEFLTDENYFPVPIIKDISLINPPYFIRPVYGAASSGVKMANSKNEVELFNNNDFLIHPFIDEDEYSIDLLMNLDGTRAIQAVCRKRSHIVGGESKISKIIDLPILEKTCMDIGEKLGLIGHNVLQAFYSDDRGIIMIEANARFGGASNLSIIAGLNSPERILKMLYNDSTAYDNQKIKFGLNMYRYSEDIICEQISGNII
jgi:carbamoyl-phosphate synthase large subunit